jgi:carbohydrate-selective porin OprB
VAHSNKLTKPIANYLNGVVWGMYFQADQRLYAEPEASTSTAPSISNNPLMSIPKSYSKEQGLYMFNEFTFTPGQNNAIPFYFQTGLVYKGLIPHRDKDQIGCALGCGFYSSYLNDYIDSQNQALVNPYGSAKNAVVPDGPTSASAKQLGTGTSTTKKDYFEYQPHFTSTQVIEGFYQVQINKWATFKPFIQYIVNPAGNKTVPNDLVLGASAKVTF